MQMNSNLILHHNITKVHVSSLCLYIWITSQISASLICLWNFEEIAKKMFLLQTSASFFRLFIQSHFQAIPCLTWRTCKLFLPCCVHYQMSKRRDFLYNCIFFHSWSTHSVYMRCNADEKNQPCVPYML